MYDDHIITRAQQAEADELAKNLHIWLEERGAPRSPARADYTLEPHGSLVRSGYRSHFRP